MEPSSPPASQSPFRRGLRYALIGAIIGLSVVIVWQRISNRNPQSMQGFLGQKPPDFPAGGTWTNAQQPLSLADLRGKVVFVQFSFIGCVFCRKMDPYLLKWHEQFAADGLVVMEVDDGNTDSLDAVREWVANNKIPYPVLYDTKGQACKLYGIHGYPSMYVIGRDGNVAWEGSGWGETTAAIEPAIRSAIASQ